MLIDIFIKDHPEDWKELLVSQYHLTLIEDGPYILIKYEQFSSDMSDPLVQECRGIIFRGDKCVCRPFKKFFNVQEPQAATIHWNSAVVLEKVDGSLMKVWYDEGWHLSTSNTIDAFKASACGLGYSFGEIFERCAQMKLDKFCENLNKNFTYLFELTAPEIQVVIPYNDGIYYLTTVDTKSWKEYISVFPDLKVKYPKEYKLNNLEDCLQIAASMDASEEGFVVRDAYLNRVKIKSAGWLEAHYTVHNHQITYAYLAELFKENKLDDLIAFFPQYISLVEDFKNKIEGYCSVAETLWQTNKRYAEDRKNFAMRVKDLPYRDYLFSKLDDPTLNAKDYILSWPINRLKKFVENDLPF